jgi:class 3 adenylate cyclase
MSQSGVLTFLIADVRGYSRFTEEYGDEAAARLAARFVDVMREGIEEHGGSFEAVRGDEGVAVFGSARQAIRAAVDLQERFAAATEADDELPLSVGIGIDSGEAVRLDDGSYRGAALNIAARLCARAHGGEVIATDATARLAGKVEGVANGDHTRLRLRNIPEPINVVHVYSELAGPRRRSVRAVLMSSRPAGWPLVLLVVLTAALTAGTVAYLTTGDTPAGMAAPKVLGDAESALEEVVPAALWRHCVLQDVADRGTTETAACKPADRLPDSWRISAYPDENALEAAYDELLNRRADIKRDSGRCNAFSWGGEFEWLHGVDRPGGRALCYFDGDDAVIVWMHKRLGQATHRDVLIVARESASDHVGLTRWWRPWHHVIGAAQ